MKKVFSILMVAFAMTAMVACGGNNEATSNGGNNNDGGTPEPVTEQNDALTDTEWSFMEGDELMIDPYRIVSIQFATNHFCFFWDNNHMVDPVVRISGYGKYTYDEATATGSATLKNQDNDQAMGTATFTVKGDELEFVFDGQTYRMRKSQ